MVLVTGGTGLVGSHLLRHLLQKGENIRAIKRASSSMSLLTDITDQIEWVDVDILDPQGLYDALDGVDEVYHCAALISFSPKDTDLMHQINVEGTANIVNMSLERGIRKLVHVSSVAAIGRTLTRFHLDEESKWEESPVNPEYGVSKYLAEREVWRGIAEGLTAVIVNPAVIVGEGHFDKGSSSLIKRVYEGLKFYPKGGTGFVDVKDLTDIMYQLMKSDIDKERFIVVNENLGYQGFFKIVAKAFNRPAPSIKAGVVMSHLGWIIEKIKCTLMRTQPLITRDSSRMAQLRYYYDNKKLINRLQFTYRPMTATVERVCQYFLAQNKTKKMLNQ